MARLNSKLRSVAFDVNRERVGIAHWCPGWEWDGSIQKPSLNPSVRVRLGVDSVCHYFLRLGRIEYCADSTHVLAGQTVDLPDWPGGDEAGFYLEPPHDFNHPLL